MGVGGQGGVPWADILTSFHSRPCQNNPEQKKLKATKTQPLLENNGKTDQNINKK